MSIYLSDIFGIFLYSNHRYWNTDIYYLLHDYLFIIMVLSFYISEVFGIFLFSNHRYWNVDIYYVIIYLL